MHELEEVCSANSQSLSVFVGRISGKSGDRVHAGENESRSVNNTKVSVGIGISSTSRAHMHGVSK